ncbi:TIGR03087 family PEP-CTERM/XrtA system glycosyltransferase [Vibrio sp. MA40-2]|uniref:TIGR03087 family PEP-CTERM/XrtA system glycosyltransferase n=1 Tax=Vibrio sp. MA40-2 TaxID=3391828 RepID=UPI0039A4FAFB
MKKKLLYLCHRIPYPPNKGDKIAAYHILKFLNKHYDVYLGCFIDDPFDNQYQDDVRAMCKEAHFVQAPPLQAKLKSLSAFVTGKPLTIPHYHSPNMHKWVKRTMADNGIEKIFMFSACVAQFALTESNRHAHKVMHFVDIDSDKWGQYAQKSTGLVRWVYAREQRKLADYEKYVTNKTDVSCFVSDSECAMFRDMLAADQQHKVCTLSNGIDSEYFSPSAEQEAANESDQVTQKKHESYPIEQDNYVVFTGAMGYRPNVEAVVWFVNEVWPLVIKQVPDGKFYIVGSSPSKQVLNLQQEQGVIVTGRVEDIRPYISNAKGAVAPMQTARGIQNKILEAMSMERSILTTELGMEGIEDYPKAGVTLASEPQLTAQWVIDKLQQDTQPKPSSRLWLKQNFSWDARLAPLLNYLEYARD